MAHVIQPPVKYVQRAPEPRMVERLPKPPSPQPFHPKPVTVWRVMKYALASILLAVVMGGVMLMLFVEDPLEDVGYSRAESGVPPPHP